jgi:choline dehydrogenase
LFFLMMIAPEYPEAGPPNRHGISLTSYINRPLSRGKVTLASGDPLDRPVIDFNYLSAPGDMRCAIAGVRWNLRILYAKSFDEIRGEELAPGVKVSERRRYRVLREADGVNHLASSWNL